MTEIDVSGCKFYYDSLPPCCNIDDTFCESNKDCYYRQLKRLEFENKLLKADYEASEAENAKLKEALEEIKEVFKKYDSEEEGTVAELLHDVFEVYGRVCEVLKDE